MGVEEIIRKLHPLERRVLPFLKDRMLFDDLINSSSMKDVEVMRALQWLENKAILKIESDESELLTLDSNGEIYNKEGLPERVFLKSVSKAEMTLGQIGEKTGLDTNELSISMGLLRRLNAIAVKKDKELFISITPDGKKLLDKESPEEKFLKNNFPLKLSSLSLEQKKIAEDLLKRKGILKREKKSLKSIRLTAEGMTLSKMKLEQFEVIDRLSANDLKTRAWEGKEFREYDVEINVPSIFGGKRHFENQVIEYIKSIWLELGFKEMTGNIVHTSFWDLDSLFVPQDHPAREMQDTFYIKDPAKGRLPDRRLVENVKNTHENGWTTGSAGWKTKWDSERAKENLLRTHTTVLSAQTISLLKKTDLPAKYFAVGKCFRNETLDWKHLFEFYQVEGIVVDPDANFSNLVGYLKEFFMKMGFPDVRIRPGHFPYTEPSAEVDVWHPVRKQWVELGGSGIFRPEVTKPLMGFEVPVLAWGLGLGRMITEYWNLTDIRDLYKNDLKQLRELRMWMK